MTDVTIRLATVADIPFLWHMLLESAFTTNDVREAWRRDAKPPPELVKYLEGWGRRGDAGVVAQDPDGTPAVPPGIACSEGPIEAMASWRSAECPNSPSRLSPGIAAAGSAATYLRRWGGMRETAGSSAWRCPWTRRTSVHAASTSVSASRLSTASTRPEVRL